MNLQSLTTAIYLLNCLISACVIKNQDAAKTQSLDVNNFVRAHQEDWLADTVGNPQTNPLGIHRLVIFGDSMSDQGNLHRRTLGIMLPPRIFYKSRFSNGPIWADYIQAPLKGWSIENHAVGGAKTRDNSLISRFFVPSLLQQVGGFIKDNKTAQADSTLIAIWIGPNNYMMDGSHLQDADGKPDPNRLNSYVDSVIKDLQEAIGQLRTAGYSHLMLATMPELGVININPVEPVRTSSATLYAATAKHNQALAELLKLYATMSSVKVDGFYAGEINQATIDHPQQWGFTRLDQPCYVGSLRGKFYGEEKFCSDPSGYKFWEYVHPNTKMHCYYASQFLNDLQKASYISGFDLEKVMDRCRTM